MSKMKEERFMVIGSDNQIYHNEFGADEEGVLRDIQCYCALAAHRSKGVV